MADTTSVHRLEADASGAIKNVSDFKKELKLAQQEVVILSEKFGATSKQAAEAAKKAAELKDKIGDAKQLVDAFNPDTKFRAFGASIQTVVGGFTALTGAMGLFGVESAEVQKTLLKVQSALALSQGISQLQEGVQAIKNLGSVLVNTLGKGGLIGIAIAGVVALGAALLGAFDGASAKVKTLNKSLDDLIKGEAEATKEVNLTKNAFKQAELGIISKKEALDKYNNGIGKTIGFAKDLNEAEKLTADNAESYIKVQGLKAQANYILAESSRLSAQARIKELELEKATYLDVTNSRGLFQKQIDAQKKDAQDLQDLIGGINAEIAKASTGFKAAGPAKETGKDSKEVVDYREKKRALTEIDQEATNAELIQKQFLAIEEMNTNALLTESTNQRVAAHVAGLEQMTAAEWMQADIRMQIAEAEAEHRRQIAAATATLLDNVSELVGRQTLAGKIMAIASATINTYLSVTKALSSYSPPVNFILAAASLAAGLVAIKKIVSVKIPGKSGGGSVPSGASVSAPLVPRLPDASTTRLDQQQLNQIGNATVRAFVVESDVSGNQERIRRLNRAARIG